MWDVRNKTNTGERLISSQEMGGAVLCTVMEIQDGNEKGIAETDPCRHPTTAEVGDAN
jgi:hypothetical protein